MNELDLIRAPFQAAPEPGQAQTARARAELHSAMGQIDRHRPRTRRPIAPRVMGALASAGLVAVLVVLFLAVPANRKAGSPAGNDLLAGVLARLEEGAANDVPVPTLAAGEFWYHTVTTRETGRWRPTGTVVVNGRTVHVVTDRPLTIESWFRPDGTSRGRYVPLTGWRPASAADETAWRRAGSPNLDAAVHAQKVGPGLDSVAHTPATSFPTANGGPANLADFAGDPVAMANALRADLGPHPTNAALLDRIGQLLYPMFSSPASVRRTLLRVLLTQVDDVTVMHFPAHGVFRRDGVLAEFSTGTATAGMLFDPDTAELLGQVADLHEPEPRHIEEVWSTPRVAPAIDRRPDGTPVPRSR